MRSSFALVSALLVLAGCSSQGRGDLDHLTPNPKAVGTPIADQNDPAHRIPSGSTLSAKGVVVVGVDTYDETNDGKSAGNVYVQDPVRTDPFTGWSGMTLYRVALSPPDLALSPGQGVDLVGPYEPFAGPASGAFKDGMLPEVVQGTISLAYEWSSPEPVDVTMADLANTATAMKYVGMLVRLKDVTITNDFTMPRQEAAINNATNLTLAGQLMPVAKAAGGPLDNGSKLKSVTGVMNYFYTLKLCPRSSADLVQ